MYSPVVVAVTCRPHITLYLIKYVTVEYLVVRCGDVSNLK